MIRNMFLLSLARKYLAMRQILIPLLVAMTVSCNPKNDPAISATEGAMPEESSTKAKPKVPEISKEETLATMNSNLLQFLKTKSFDKFATYIHPLKGVRFSMYAFVSPEKDKIFSKKEFLESLPGPEKFTWGNKDGSGEVYAVPLQNYLTDWVWKKDFTQSKYELNGKISHGNSKDNAREIYPGADVTVNYIPGTAQYSEMDWQTLSFVFEEYNGRYYLTGVINDQWTT